MTYYEIEIEMVYVICSVSCHYLTKTLPNTVRAKVLQISHIVICSAIGILTLGLLPDQSLPILLGVSARGGGKIVVFG